MCDECDVTVLCSGQQWRCSQWWLALGWQHERLHYGIQDAGHMRKKRTENGVVGRGACEPITLKEHADLRGRTEAGVQGAHV